MDNKRRIISLIILTALMITSMPAVSFAASSSGLPSVNDKSVCYTPADDYRGGDCVLTSCKIMFRRYAISQGSQMWTTLTNNAIRPYAAPLGGMYYTFSYKNDGITYNVTHGYFTGSDEAAKRNELQKLLKTHPEGVIVWGPYAQRIGGPHAVLAVKVSGDTIYAAEPVYNVGDYNKGIQKWSNTTMSDFNKCTKYWLIESTSGRASSAGSNVKSTLRISDVQMPSSISRGSGFTIRGRVDSNYLIKKVNVAVLNSSGKKVITRSDAPNSWTYDVYAMDPVVKFGNLKPGTYTYRISAIDEKSPKKLRKLHENKFTVVRTSGSGTSEIRLSDATIPSAIKEGDGFNIEGMVRSTARITKVNIFIRNSKGKKVIGSSADPEAYYFDLASLDTDIKFGTLAPGKYRYVITMKDTEQSAALVDSAFTVKSKNPASTLRIRSFNYPKKLKRGKNFGIKGVIKSNYKIKKIRIIVANASGKVIFKAAVKPGRKTYNLKKLSKKVRKKLAFRKLKKGRYVYKITAKDARKSKVLVKKTFRVR